MPFHHQWGHTERAALLALVRTRPGGARVPDLIDMVSEQGSAVAVWHELTPQTLFDADSSDSGPLADADADLRRWAGAEYRFHAFADPTYPDRLRSVRQMPPFVFTCGQSRSDDIRVSVVGTREPSSRGAAFAARVTELLVGHEVTVVAGLARGIDTVAHQTALDRGGRTVAVLGNGVEYVYPRENAALQARIRARGMLLSQFEPDARPAKWTFPARNITMSAYGHATVVVEAGERSGTRIQAAEAVGHGRPVIMTTMVATGTEWGAALVGQPGVFVADSPEQAVEHIETVVDRDDRVAALLSHKGLI